MVIFYCIDKSASFAKLRQSETKPSRSPMIYSRDYRLGVLTLNLLALTAPITQRFAKYPFFSVCKSLPHEQIHFAQRAGLL